MQDSSNFKISLLVTCPRISRRIEEIKSAHSGVSQEVRDEDPLFGFDCHGRRVGKPEPGGCAGTGHVHQGRRSDPAKQMSGLSPTGYVCPDVVADPCGRSAVA